MKGSPGTLPTMPPPMPTRKGARGRTPSLPRGARQPVVGKGRSPIQWEVSVGDIKIASLPWSLHLSSLLNHGVSATESYDLVALQASGPSRKFLPYSSAARSAPPALHSLRQSSALPQSCTLAGRRFGGLDTGQDFRDGPLDLRCDPPPRLLFRKTSPPFVREVLELAKHLWVDAPPISDHRA